LALGKDRSLITRLDSIEARHADFRGANLKQASLKGADLSAANLIGAQIDGADFAETVLGGTLGLKR